MEGYRLFLITHIGAGSVALAMFWIAALARKGSSFHRRVGQGFFGAMFAVLASGVPLTLGMIERGRPASAMFLAFLLLLTGSGCWNAWCAVRRRRDRLAYFGGLFWMLAAINAVAGIGIVVLGIRLASPLFQIFGGVGVFVLVDSILRWRKSAQDPMWWLREHYGAMIGNGVATHIAFFSIGLRNAFPGIDPALVQHFAWFGPLAVAFVAAFWLGRRYGRRPGARAAIPQASGRFAGRTAAQLVEPGLE
ncbi:hypothetical protein [Dokdonella sp.]|uniref:hypothetical protein n=1 Tax=Dokdonella sp. TaxID=2291710 RepID=UPI0025C31AEA|nr:hypothetical protein [Dokdonella sp.]MBX3693526.1 hypothetical protein [Dokdonella sp.]MCW5567502.1 hypothetical protein [Dokdonella sp.]